MTGPLLALSRTVLPTIEHCVKTQRDCCTKGGYSFTFKIPLFGCTRVTLQNFVAPYYCMYYRLNNIIVFFSFTIVQSDYRVHIFHCQRDALWVNQWIRGILEARRYQVTTNSQPFGDCDRVIIVLSQNMAKAPANVRKAADGIRGRISLGIKKEHCIEPNEIKDRCLGYIDMSRVSMYDYTFQYHLMKNVIKCLFLPEPIGSA